MSDKRKDDAGVLGSLPSTRPTGLRAERSRDAGQARPAKASNGRAGAKSRTKAAAGTKSPSQKAAAGTKASTSRKAAKPKPKAAGKPRAVKKTTTEPAPSAPAAEPTVPHRPRPVRAGAPALAESTERARSEAHEPLEPGAAPPSGTELVTTAVQAAGELAQIGLKLSGRALKRAVERLPKP
jgi:hypothetical protein